jgi:hypothetical protein
MTAASTGFAMSAGIELRDGNAPVRERGGYVRVEPYVRREPVHQDGAQSGFAVGRVMDDVKVEA